jgi:hypothetical protein
VTNGVGCNMLKANAKRRRTKGEVKAAKLKEQKEKEEIGKKLAEFDAMKAHIEQLQSQAANGENAAQILTNLVHTNQAQIDEDGNFMLSEQSVSIQDNQA